MNQFDKAADQARKFLELRQTFSKTGEQFMYTELDLAKSLIEVGETTCDPEHRDRSYQEAAAGYRTVVRTLPRLALPRARSEHILARLRSLRSVLGNKGVTVEDVEPRQAPG
jgi:hypothetical protein